MAIQSYSVKYGFYWTIRSYQLFFRYPIKLTLLCLSVIVPVIMYYALSVGYGVFHLLSFGNMIIILQLFFLVAAHLIVTENKLRIKKLFYTLARFDMKQYGQILITIIFFEILNYISSKWITSPNITAIYFLFIFACKYVFCLIYPIILWEKKNLYDAMAYSIHIVLKNFLPLFIFFIGSALLPFIVFLVPAFITTYTYTIGKSDAMSLIWPTLTLLEGTLTLIPFMLAQYLIYRDCIKNDA